MHLQDLAVGEQGFRAFIVVVVMVDVDEQGRSTEGGRSGEPRAVERLTSRTVPTSVSDPAPPASDTEEQPSIQRQVVTKGRPRRKRKLPSWLASDSWITSAASAI